MIEQERMAVTWAAGTLKNNGCTLHPFMEGSNRGWDILTLTGWETANNWRELCSIAKTVAEQHTKRETK